MRIKKTPLVIAVGTTLVSGLTATSVQAESIESSGGNPFEINELSSGYMFVAEADKEKKGNSKMKDGTCGAGQCGANMMPEGAMEKTVEGKCAGNKPTSKAKKMDMEGKCGEGKCGDNIK